MAIAGAFMTVKNISIGTQQKIRANRKALVSYTPSAIASLPTASELMFESHGLRSLSPNAPAVNNSSRLIASTSKQSPALTL